MGPGAHAPGSSLALSIDAPVSHARPSVDVLFESAARAYRTGVVCVMLTGTGEDGSAGARAIKARGGLVLVEDPGTAEVGAMPLAAIATGSADRVLPLARIGPALVELAGAL